MRKFDTVRLRKTILDMAFTGSTVHIGCAFSIVELLAVLYRNHLRFDENDPKYPHRDYMVLSKGHGVMAQYACLHQIGWLGDDDITRYFENGTKLKGLADAHVPGIEVTAGSLGHGLSVGVGLALAAKMYKSDQMCYALVGDGELNEGPIWEAALFAAQFKLDNLVIIVDANGFQAMGKTDEVIGLGDIQAKFNAFGFDAVTIDGHDEPAIDRAYQELKTRKDRRPKALIAQTIKGKGVSFMEHDNIWHYTRLNSHTYEAALAELGDEV
ncbi:transketolase [Paraburkholderia phenoliruptrix]|uniref:Transketolase domain-containing protein n=2 Tax=Paraburkholderia phenoliruptrix TaxID=252970 RepID=K0DFS7_9BURK|nr:transketolase [Paraburkholderia phenoliruptrix]AFT84796.1 transketolase domain-containing protein [Paraburkholderia phenoliruptrix BR3459a]CAB4050512.1 Apulose-4-phosphate transketolase subunit A [Paraburkholderia phenoliruptrix]